MKNMGDVSKKVDSRRIAEVAGVSRSTVSRVLNQPEIVKPETRQRVMEAIKQFSYTPNLSAQLLTGKKSNTIGLFLCTTIPTSRQNLEDSHMDYVLRCILSHASLRGYHTLVTLIFNKEEPGIHTKITEMFYQNRIEAGVFVGFPDGFPTIEHLISEGFGVGIFDSDATGKTEANRIVINFDDLVGENAVDYLVSLGHRDIGAIHGDLKRYNGLQKHDAFMRGMQKNGLAIRDEWMMYCDFNMDLAQEQVRQMVKSGAKLPTAIFATNDSIACVAVEALNGEGIKVPGDISVIGVDDSFISRFYTPPLTTFRINFKQMLEVLTSKVIEHTKRPFERQFSSTFGAVLVERDSCRFI